MHHVEYIVIGAGIAGASAAYELAAHGEVVLFEREVVAGYHTTGRSAALYTETWEHGVVRALTLASRAFLESPPEGFSDYPLLSPEPLLIVGRPDQRHLVDRLMADATRAVANISTVDGATAERLCPLLRPGYVAAAAYEPGSRSIDVDALHQGFLRGMRRRGSTLILRADVEQVTATPDGWTVVAGEHEATAPVVVNASGAWADVVGAMAGASPIGLVPMRRTAFTFPAPEDIDLTGSAMVVDVGEGFYFKPEGGQILGSLADQTPMEPQDVRPEEIDVALAIERIQRATILQIRHVRRTWAGLRSFVADRNPVVGEDPIAPGFFWLAGQGGAGIMTSPAMSRALAGLVTTGEIPDDLQALGVTASELSPRRIAAD